MHRWQLPVHNSAKTSLYSSIALAVSGQCMQSTINAHLFVSSQREGLHWNPQLWSLSCPACLRHRVRPPTCTQQCTVCADISCCAHSHSSLCQEMLGSSNYSHTLASTACTAYLDCLPVCHSRVHHSPALPGHGMNISHTKTGQAHTHTPQSSLQGGNQGASAPLRLVMQVEVLAQPSRTLARVQHF